MNIALIVDDGTHTMINVIIVNSTYVNFFSQVTFFRKMVTMIATQAKIVSYCDQHLEDDFIPLAIKMFGCLHQQVDNFL